jgi:biotin synthase
MLAKATRLKFTEDMVELLESADHARRLCCGDEVHVRAVVEFSNVCHRDCLYCGLRRSNTSLRRYAMSLEETVQVATMAAEEGARTVVLQSGENDFEKPERLASLIEAIKQRLDVAVTLSVGVKSRRFYAACKEAGADRYLLKHETASRGLYEMLHPDSRLTDRIEALGVLRQLGYQTGTGNIVGLPGQTREDVDEDIELAHELDVDMAAFGPFVPHPDTPLAHHRAGGIEISLRTVAAARIALPDAHIPATTALDAIHPEGRMLALQCGANVFMANATPERYRDLYSIYPRDTSGNAVRDVRNMLERLGRPLARDYGHSLKPRQGREPCRKPQKA